MDVKDELREIATMMMGVEMRIKESLLTINRIKERIKAIYDHDCEENKPSLPGVQIKSRTKENRKGYPIGGRDH